MTTAILGALKYLPASLGIKALEKISPKFKSYFAQVAAYGLDANRALEYVSDQFSREGGVNPKGTRPDVKAARTDVRNAGIPGKALRTGLAFGGAGALTPRETEQPEVAQQPSNPIPQVQPSAREQANAKLNEQERQRLDQFEEMFGKGYIENPPRLGKGKRGSKKSGLMDLLNQANQTLDRLQGQ